MQPYAAQHLRPSSCARAPSPRPPSTACAAAKPKSFSPLQAFGLFKNKPKAEKDPVTQALEEMEFRHPANAKATRAAAAAAEKAKLEAERREGLMAADRSTVERLLGELQGLNKKAAEAGYADVRLVEAKLRTPEVVPLVQEMVRKVVQVIAPPAPPPPEPQVEPEPEPEAAPWREAEAPPRDEKGGRKRCAEGSGREVVLQAFNWESWKGAYYQTMIKEAPWFADLGFTYVWMPPMVASVSEQGYMPNDYFNLNSHYGSVDELKDAIAALKEHGLRVAGDCVLNHRCALHQDENGVYNRFGGTLDWDASAVCGDDHEYGGAGHRSTGERFHAAPNIDHKQKFVRDDIVRWLQWLRSDIGIDGYRLDFAKGFGGEFVKEYCERSEPHFVVGEYWDSLAYEHGTAAHNQDAHRQRIINWINAAGDQATAFDVTTKGILHEVFGRGEYWRLRDASGNPPGVLGWWPSRTTTFLENHDTGSTQAHWPFPGHAVQQGYAYLLTHPGTPTVFYDHLHDEESCRAIKALIDVRQRNKLHVRSVVNILRAEALLYAAEIDGKLMMKIGPDHFDPGEGWRPAGEGNCWCVWERE